MDPYLWKRIWRRPWLSLCSLVLCAVLCLLLCFMSGYREEQQAKLLEVRKSFEIECVVTNLRGTQSTSLRLGPWASYFVTAEEYDIHRHITDLRMVKEYEITCPKLGISEGMLYGVTNEHCADDLDSNMGGQVTCLEADFYGNENMVCLVSKEMYDLLGEEKTIIAAVTDPYINRKEQPELGFGEVEFRVVGYYAGRGTNLYIPYPASEKLSIEISRKVTVDAISFIAADNLALEELALAAREKLSAVDPMAPEESNPTVAALVIRDEQYNATVAALEQNIERTRFLLPVIALLGLGVGFLISFLSTRGEGRTYALMRTLGLTRGKLFVSILREQMMLCLLAVLATAMVTGKPTPALCYLLCYTVGCCAALLHPVRTAPTAILREQE